MQLKKLYIGVKDVKRLVNGVYSTANTRHGLRSSTGEFYPFRYTSFSSRFLTLVMLLSISPAISDKAS